MYRLTSEKNKVIKIIWFLVDECIPIKYYKDKVYKWLPKEKEVTYGGNSFIGCRMGDYELSVEQTESKISEIVIALSEKKAWDKHTVITLLNRMEKREQCHLREMAAPKSIIR